MSRQTADADAGRRRVRRPTAGAKPESGLVKRLRPWMRAEYLVPAGCVAAALLLALSELLTSFELVAPDGTVVAEQSAADRHGYALLVLALFAIGATVVAVASASRPATFAVAIAGLVALLTFAIGDLPDVNETGTVRPFVDASAEPQLGFWLGLLGALLLALAGGALATLTPDQLRGWRRVWEGRRSRAGREGGKRGGVSRGGGASRGGGGGAKR